MRRISRLTGPLIALSLMVGLFLVPGSAARATFPGVDGRIAFSDYVTGEIYAVNPDGSGLVQLTDVRDGRAAEWPDWSPNSTHIAFDSDRSGSLRLWIMNADGSHQRMVAGDRPAAADLLPVYTPDGNRLVYTRCVSRACAIFSIGVDGTHRRALTPLQRPPFEVFDYWPSVSPDGQWIAFQRFNQNVEGIISQVYVMRSDGTDSHPVTRPGLEANVPDWSPDGTRITFTGPWSLGENVYTMNKEGRDVRKLTGERFPHNSYASSYSPSGTQITYLNDDAYPDICCADLFVMQADGSEQKLVPTGSSAVQSASWGTAPPIAADSVPAFAAPAVSAEAAARLAARCRLLPRPLRVMLPCP
jgi:Tol biopolymer transport system component